MIIFVWSCKCRHIYEKAMIIQYYFFSPSICVSLVTELNKKKGIYLSKGKAFYVPREANYNIFVA